MRPSPAASIRSIAVVLLLSAGLGLVVTIAAPIGFDPDPLPNTTLTGWNSPPFTLLLVLLASVFLIAGVQTLRSGLLLLSTTVGVLGYLVGAAFVGRDPRAHSRTKAVGMSAVAIVAVVMISTVAVPRLSTGPVGSTFAPAKAIQAH